MERRIFHCSTCGYHLRFGVARCSRCYRPTRLYNRKGFWWTIVLIIALVGVQIARYAM